MIEEHTDRRKGGNHPLIHLRGVKRGCPSFGRFDQHTTQSIQNTVSIPILPWLSAWWPQSGLLKECALDLH